MDLFQFEVFVYLFNVNKTVHFLRKCTICDPLKPDNTMDCATKNILAQAIINWRYF